MQRHLRLVFTSLLIVVTMVLVACDGSNTGNETDNLPRQAATLKAVADLTSFQIKADEQGHWYRVRQGRVVEDVTRMRSIFLTNGKETVSDNSPAPFFSELKGGPGIYLLHHVGPIRSDVPAVLKQSGLVILDYVPENAFLVYDSGANTAKALQSLKSRIDLARLWQPDDRMHWRLRNIWGELDVAVYVVNHPDASETRKLVGDMATETYMAPVSVKHHTIYKVRLHSKDLATLLGRPDVYWVEPWVKPKLMDERQGLIMAGQHDGTRPNAGVSYYNWLGDRQLLTGLGDIVVDITDSGCDRGTPEGIGHPDLQGRVLYINNYTGQALGNDVDGHGTINTSIVGAQPPNFSATGVLDTEGYLYGLGIAPGVKLAASRVFDAANWDTGTTTLTEIVHNSMLGGAQISTNSWGAAVEGEYNAEAQEYDAIVRDSNRNADDGITPMIVLFAAGNDGDGGMWGSGETFTTIGAPGTAKNVITVGATENWRMTGTDGCGTADSGADNLTDLANFSSRGFTLDGRLKPDISAPGTHIQGVASSDPNYMDGQGVCDFYWPSGQTLYAWSSGTSHSTPAMAGASALFVNWYKHRDESFGQIPSPALVKAMLSVHSADAVGGDTGWDYEMPNIPNKWIGWGRLDMSDAFGDVKRVIVDQSELFTETGQTFTIGNLRPFDPTKPVRISLAYSDAPGATTGNAYVNNLDLVVTVNGADEYLGNVFANGLSTTGGTADDKNNLENVFFAAGASQGVMDVTVIATNIAGDAVPGNGLLTDQDFVLYMFNVQDRLECQTSADCDDDNPCTNEFCDTDNLCTTSPKCDDENVCTFNRCDRDTGVCSYPSISCDDNNACTADSCDPADGCAHTPANTCGACDVAVDVAGNCFDGQCESCDDGNPCTADSCDSEQGCVNEIVADCTACGEAKSCINGLCLGGILNPSEISFEDDAFPRNFSTGGNADWFITTDSAHEGSFSARSGSITDNGISWLAMEIELDINGSISFFHRESTEGCCDFLVFMVDDDVVAQFAENNDWVEYAYSLAAGTHTIRWAYEKDGSVAEGADAVWIDAISIEGMLPPACNDDNSCTVEMSVNDSCVYCTLGNGTPCDDGNECTENVACNQGVCAGDALPDETPCSDDDNACTADWCVAGECVHPAVPDLTVCGEDNNLCTADYCIAGECNHTAASDGEACSSDPDNDSCTVETCTGGSCQLAETLPNCTPCGSDSDGVCVDGMCGGMPIDIVAGFEDGSLPAGWTDDENTPWTTSQSRAHSGSFSAVSGDIDDNQTSTLLASVTLNEAGSVSFYYLTSTEECCDELHVYIDGQKMDELIASSWTLATYPLIAGEHTLAWVYAKDGSVSNGDDAVYVDDIVITGINARCDDGDPCTQDSLGENGQCVFCPMPEGSACQGDNVCQQNFTCQAGACIGEPVTEATACEDDGNFCTDDVCDSGDCTHPPVANGSSCAGDPAAGECTTAVCDGGLCITDPVDDCTPCASGAKACIGGQCGGADTVKRFSFEDQQIGTEWTLAGDANWAITDSYAHDGSYSIASGTIGDNQISTLSIDVEIADSGEILFDALVLSQSCCDTLHFYVDGNEAAELSSPSWETISRSLSDGAHTLSWVYEKDSGTSQSEDKAYLDSIRISGLVTSCTNSNTCAWVGLGSNDCVVCPKPDDYICEDELFCTESSTCKSGVCTELVARDCSATLENPECQQASCDEENDACVVGAINENGSCEDGKFCTTASVCVAGQCQATEQRDCSAAVTDPACQLPECNELTDSCGWVAANESASCAVNDWCTTDSVCLNGYCTGAERDCSGAVGNPQCQNAACDAQNYLCYAVDTNEGGACNDGLFCTVNDSCASGDCAGVPNDCADAIQFAACQSASCNEQTDSCDLAPINENGACDDGLFCTVADSCQSGACTGSARDCSAAITVAACQQASCNEQNGACEAVAANNGGVCDDGLLCTENDSCADGACTGSAKTCDDAIACTVDSCNETEGCVHSPDDTLCDDDNDWTTDSCDASAGCQYDEAGSCAQAIAVNSASYSDADSLAGRPNHLDGYAGDCDAKTLDGPDVVYHVDPADCQCGCATLKAEVSPDGIDIALTVVSACDSGASCIALVDDAQSGASETVTFAAPAYLVVEAVANSKAAGDYSLTISEVCGDGDIDGDSDGDTDDDLIDGDQPDGDQPDGDQPDGDQPDGDQPDGDQPDGDNPDGDSPDGDLPDGDEPEDGDVGPGVGGGGDGGCNQTHTGGALMLLLGLAAIGIVRRRRTSL